MTYLHLDGDAGHVMKYLVTDYKNSMDFMIGLMKLKKENPLFMEQTLQALEGSDVCMYGTCSGFVRDAADKIGIPKVKSFEHYTAQNGRKVLTFYPVSPILMPKDPKWGKHIHVTGYWYHPEEDACGYEADTELEHFLTDGEKPIFIAFGKAESKELAELQNRVVEALKETGIKAVVQAFQITEPKKTEKIHFVGKIPYSYIFPRVRAVVHHGGCTTNGIGIWAGCPTLIIPLALDQWYYGRTVHELGMGPEPLYIRKKLCTKEQIKDALMELVSGKYEKRAEELSRQIRQENGIEEAIQAIEEYVNS